MDLGSLIIHLRVDGGELKTAEVALNNLGEAANKAAAKSATSFKHVISQTNMFAQRVRTIGYLTSAVLTAPILGAGKAILDATKDFEYSMQMIVGLVGESQSTVDQWKESLLKMGKEVGKTPKELAEGLYFLTSSGIQGARALEVLEISAKAATAGLGQTQEVADLLSSALNAYAGTGLTAAKAADILVAAVREGKGEADAFARSMGQIIPIAANLGVSFDQVAGAMAAMTLTGSSAANAAVYLKGVFNSLMTANDQGAKVLERAGSSYQKLRDILKSGPEGLINVLQEFRDIQMQLGDEAIKDVLPNIRALTGFMSIAGKNFQYNSKIMREITKSTGALNAAFIAMEGTLKVRMDKALAGLQASLITLGTDVAPTIVEILEELTNLLDRLTEKWNTLTDAQKRFRLIGIAAAAAIGPLSLLLSSVIYIASGLVELVYHLGKGVIAFVKFGKAAMTSATMLKALNVASVTSARGVAMIVGSLGVWAGALTAVTLGYIKLRKARKEAEEAMPSATDATALDPLKAQLKTIRDGDFADEDIESKMQLLSKMDAAQLQELQGMIGTRIQLEKDFRIDLMAIREKGLADDEYILKRRSQIQKLYTDIYDKQESLGFFKVGSELYKNVQKEIKDIENTISSLRAQIAVHKEEMGDWIDVQIEGISKIIERYEEMGNTVEEELKKIGMSAEEIDNLTAAVNAYNEALDNIKSSHESELAYLEFMRNNAKDLGIEFDYLGGKTELLKSTLKDLAKSGTLGSTFGKGIIEQLKQLPTNLYEVTKLIKDLDEDFDFLFEKSKIDVDFDVNAAAIDLLEDARDSLIRFKLELKDTDVLVTPFGAAIPVVDIIDKKIELLTNDIKLFSAEQQRLIDTKTLSLLNAEADAFGTMSGKVDVLTYQLQAAKRNLRELLQEQLNPKSNQIISDEMIKNAVENIQKVKYALQELESAIDIKYYEDMYNAWGSSANALALLDANISAIESKLRALSEQGLENTFAFKMLTDRLKELQAVSYVVDTLSNAFGELVDALITGSETAADVLKRMVTQMISDLIKLVVKMAALKIIMTILFPEMSAAQTTAAAFAGAAGIPKFAGGGIIPPGYPNDTYPALLSSGEMVLPKNIVTNLNRLSKQKRAISTPDTNSKILQSLRKQKDVRSTAAIGTNRLRSLQKVDRQSILDPKTVKNLSKVAQIKTDYLSNINKMMNNLSSLKGDGIEKMEFYRSSERNNLVGSDIPRNNTDIVLPNLKGNQNPLSNLTPAEVNVNLTLDSKIKNRDIALIIRRMKNWN